MSKLKITSFTKVDPPLVLGHHFTHTTEDGREVVLESCMAGYCVGIFDERQNIIGTKTCTDFKDGMTFEKGIPALEKAVQIANEKLNYER